MEYRYYDDNGNLIDSALTRTSRVPTNISDSLLSDETGTPITVYRGYAMKEDRLATTIEETVAGTAADYIESGFYFTSDPEEAQMYAESHTDKSEEPPTAEFPEGGRINRHYSGDYAKVSAFHLKIGKGVLEFNDLHDFNRNRPEDIKGYLIKLRKGTLTTDASEYFVTDPTQVVFAQEEVKPSKTPTQFNELQQYANQVGLAEALPKVEEVKQAVEETKQIQDKYVYTFDDGLEVKLDFELNDQQKSALKELEAFVNGDDTSITLSGYAGTGKTTIMGIFNEYLKRRIQADIIFSAPTHRANAVTRQKTPNAKVITLQSLLGLRPDFDITEDVFDLHKLKFEQVAEVKIEPAAIVIVDEASMIQDSLYDFLLEQIAAKGAQIIFMGDKGQLRPVKANNISKVFRNDGAQLQLTKVERTGDNPILKESTRVRNGEDFSYETDIAPNGQGVEYSSDKTRIREFVRTSLKEMKDSQDPLYFRVLAATNSSVEAYNSAIRQILYGRRPAQLYEGELVMGYSNREYDSLRKKYKLMNSGDYVVQSVKPTTIQIDLTYPDRKESISMEGYKVTLKDAIDTSASSFTIDVVSNFETDENIIKVQEYIQTLWSMRKQLLAEGNPTAARSVVEKINRIQNKIHTMRDIKDANGRLKLRKSFDYGYAHTIHKSQGGTYSKVLINDSSINTFGFNDKNGQEVRQELKYVAVSRAKNYVMVQTLEKAKQQVVEDYDLDEEFVSATAADLKQAANDSATEELDKMGKQRKKECE